MVYVISVGLDLVLTTERVLMHLVRYHFSDAYLFQILDVLVPGISTWVMGHLRLLKDGDVIAQPVLS